MPSQNDNAENGNHNTTNRGNASSLNNSPDGSAQSNFSSMPVITLPKGGGAIKGIDDKFQVNAFSGTSGFSIPISYSPGRGGHTPGIGLNYNSGSGNSPFGIGWQLSVPSIVRKTENYLPKYQDSLETDIFMLSGTEDLVPVLKNNAGTWERVIVPPNPTNAGFAVALYQPRIEGTFARIEKWTNNTTAEVHWRVINSDNSTSFFGLTAESRIYDPANNNKVFEWLLCQTSDDKGNIMLFSYKREDFAGVPNKLNEKNRLNNCTQTYLKMILYGNRTPYSPAAGVPAEKEFLFKVIFDYGEHDTAMPVPMDIYKAKNPWTCRKDPFSSYRPGFELRTYRRCCRVMMFHCFDATELPVNPYLVNSLQLFYDDDLQLTGNGNQLAGFSFLTKARQNGHILDAASSTYTTKSLPDFDLSYQQHEWDTTVADITGENIVNAPVGIDNKNYLWVDLYNEGIAGILVEQGDGWYYKSNLGSGTFTPAIPIAQKPSFTGLAGGSLSVHEIEGNGVKYLVQSAKSPQGFFKLDEDAGWEGMKIFENFPNTGISDANTRFIDLNADGRPELLQTGENLFRWYESVGEKGFKVSGTVVKEFDEEKGPAIIFADSTQSIFLADMSGDGLTDILRIRNGEICYWPNLGYGHFGAKVAMDNAPVFDYADNFNPAFLRLADIDGSGTTDVIYLGRNDFRVWMNMSGNEWTAVPQVIPAFPQINNNADVQVLDFLGSGTACIVYSSPLAGGPLRYINLMNAKKPNLLIGYSNNCGLETELQYKSSTSYYLADKLAGIPWITKLPFPVHCVSKVTVRDRVRETVFTNQYSYRHGYYDAIEKEFRGFARVEHYDTEDFQAFALNTAKNVVEQDLHQPPVRTIAWYHTGAYMRNEKILHQCENEYFQNTSIAEYNMPEALMPALVPPENLHEAYRACKGLLLRTEVYSNDGSTVQDIPYSASQSNCQVILLQPGGPNRYASFIIIQSESISYDYERIASDPRIVHSFVLDADKYGNITKAAVVVYPRLARPFAPNDVPDIVWAEQNKLHIKYKETLYTTDIIEDDSYRLRTSYEIRDYELNGIAQPATFYIPIGTLGPAIAAAAEITYDQDFGAGTQKRLSGHSRVYYAADDLLSARTLGDPSPLGIAYKAYRLAFTNGLVSKYYGAKVTNTMLQQAKYTHLEGDSDWWGQTGTLTYLPNPASNFYMPVATVNVLGKTSKVQYDRFNLLLESTTDAIGNSVAAVNDYRTLSPVLITDPNLNRSAVETDELGMIIKSAVMGKAGSSDGDTLADPTAKMDYNIHNWQINGKPNYSRVQEREIHGPANIKWQESYVYSDGSGGIIMSKSRVAAGTAKKWNVVTKHVDEVPADPRWIGNGRTILNNKGNPVKTYEPYFSATSDYEAEVELVETGVTPIIYYDAAGRNIRTELPNGTFSKTEFDGWFQKVYDVNDTVKDSQWYIDRGSPDPAGSEPLDPEKRAAWLAAAHYNTPGIIHTDSLGRTFYTISDYGNSITSSIYAITDLVGRYALSFDQLGRNVATSYTNLLGQSIKAIIAEKGTKWVFTDVLGRLVKMWDNDIYEFRTSYDDLNRPLSTYVNHGATETVFANIVYGDLLAPATAEAMNMKGRAYKVYDQAGVINIDGVDFKGNVIAASRQFCSDYQNQADWTTIDGLTDIPTIKATADLLLDTSESFNSVVVVDALNRPVTVTLPDNSVITPTYDEANSLASLAVNILGAAASTNFLVSQAYNEKGQRKYAKFGCNAVTNYVYDPETFRLTNLVTKQNPADADSVALQNLAYNFDPVGNITQIRDDAQQTRFFRNAVIYPENKFQYDALYQLTMATGREHSGLGTDTQPNRKDIPVLGPIPELNSATAVGNYTENYQYDLCGNILSLQHIASGGNWTRRYKYQYQDDATDNTNRLKASSLPGDGAGTFSGSYGYDGGTDNGLHGNMTSMPHLSAANSLVWNFADQLSSVNLRGGGMAYYVYDMGGNRVRKIIKRRGGRILERIYLGAVEIYRERTGAADPDLERLTLHVSDNTGRIAQVDTKTIDKTGVDPANPLGVSVTRYQFNNHLGSASLETDGSGNIISYEEYHPFGTSSYRVSQTGSNISLKRYRFSGKERDDETGLYYFGARYFAAWLGRWTSSDPAGFVDGLNLFRYCQNSPIIFNDPNGTDSNKPAVGQTAASSDAGYEATKVNTPEARAILDKDFPVGKAVETSLGTGIITGPSTWNSGLGLNVLTWRIESATLPEVTVSSDPKKSEDTGNTGESAAKPPGASQPDAAANSGSAPASSPGTAGTASSLAAAGTEKYIWEGMSFRKRGFTMEHLYNNDILKAIRSQGDNRPLYDVEDATKVKQIKSSNGNAATLRSHASKATRDAGEAIKRNPTGTMAGKSAQAVVITPTDGAASAAAEVQGGYSGIKKPVNNSLPPEHIRGLPGVVGAIGKALTGVGAVLSAAALIGDLRHHDWTMAAGDTLGTAGGGLEVYAMSTAGATVLGASAMTLGLVLGGLGIAATSAISGIRAYRAGDTKGAIAGAAGFLSGLAITAGVIGGFAAAPALLIAGVIGAVGVGIFHIGRYFNKW